MDRLLQLPPDHKIKSFQLSFCVGREFTCHVERWMRRIARLGIEELILQFACEPFVINMPGQCSLRELINFPLQLLSEASMLRSLCLFACNLEPNIQGPFRSLVSLRLDAVPLVDVEGILLSCPKLESLILIYCGLPSKLFIGGPELELKSLTFLKCFGVAEIALCAGNLTMFETVCSYIVKLSPSYVPKLQQVYLRLNENHELAVVGEIVKNMPQLESLYLQAVDDGILYEPADLPTFNNIRQLYFQMEFDFMFDVQKMSGFIIACPLLERLHLETKGRPCYEQKRIVLSPRYHAYLKEVEYGGFLGLQDEISLILFLLKSAVALEQMSISMDCRYYIGGGRWNETKNPAFGTSFGKEELETFHQQLQGQAASSTARVMIW